MPVSFPASPTVGQTYSYGTTMWTWDGTSWNITTSGGIVGEVSAFFLMGA